LERAHRDRLMGRCCHARARHKKAIAWTQRALEAYERLGDAAAVCQCRRTLLAVYVNAGKYELARECGAQTLADRGVAEEERLKVHVNMGALEHRLHDYAQALSHYQTALRLLRDDPKTEAVVLYNLANVLVCVNRFSEAEGRYRRALELFDAQGASLYRAHALQALGYLYSILGQYFLAENRIREAHVAYLAHGDRVGAALCDLDAFSLNVRLNRSRAALDEAEPLIETFTKLGLPYETGLVYYEASAAAAADRDADLAEAYLDEAEGLFESCGNRHFLALCRLRRGQLLSQGGASDEARRHIEAARAVFLEQKLGELELSCTLELCRIDGRFFDDAGYRRARSLLAGAVSHDVRIRTLLMISDYWHAKGQLKRAIKSRFEAVMTIEESRATIESKDLRESFFGDKAGAYETLVEWLFQWRNPKAPALVFKALSLSRSRQFSEQLSRFEQSPPALNRNEPSLLEMNKLETRLAQLSRKMQAMASRPDFAEAERSASLKAYEDTLKAIRDLKWRMRDEDRLGFYYPVDFNPEEIQRRLPADCLAVLYFVGGQRLYRIELNGAALKTFQFPLHQGFNRDLNLLSQALANRRFEQGGEAADALARLAPLLRPSMLEGCRRLVFIPHKRLHLFPFALLPAKRSGLLLEKHAICVCPNLAALYFSLKRPAAALEKPVFFFSRDPADPAASEREYLTRRFPNAAVFSELREPSQQKTTLTGDLFHFAGHCVFNRGQPNRSYLQMAGKKLYLSRLRGLRFHRAFINLASCQSGTLSLMAGNEPYGFVASFFAAGAVNILASLWELDDEAAGEWMTHFYRNIDAGLAEAHRQACLAMRARRSDPWFWAGMTLLGKP